MSLIAGKSYVLQRGAGKPDVRLTVEAHIAGGGQAAIFKGNMTNLGDVVIRSISLRKQGLSPDTIRNTVAKEISALKNTRLSAKENKRNAANVEGCNPHINCYYGMIKYGKFADGGGGGGGVPGAEAEPFVYWSTETLPDHLYLIYEFIGGKTLETKIQEKLTAEQIISYGRQLLIGINSLHAVDKVHLDLKPANIMITDDNKLKIIDFGFARDVNDVLLRRLPGLSFDHIAPEGWELYADPKTVFSTFVRTRLIDPKALDMFAIGCIFYKMFTKANLINFNVVDSMAFKKRDPESIVLPEEYNKFLPFVRQLVSFDKNVLHVIEGINKIEHFNNYGEWTSQIKTERDKAQENLRTVEQRCTEVAAPDAMLISERATAQENMNAAQQVSNIALNLLRSFIRTAEGQAAVAAAGAAARAAAASAAAARAAAGGAGEGPAAPARAAAPPPKVSRNRLSAPDALRMWCELNEIERDQCGRMAGGGRRSRRRKTSRRRKQTRRRR